MLLHTDQLPPGYSSVAEMAYIFDNQRLFVVTSGNELFFVKKAPALFPEDVDEQDNISIYQTEFPIEAAQWFVDSIEQKLWRSAVNGGLPSGVNHLEEKIAGEQLRIRRTMGAGGPGQKGFYLINLSRNDLRYDDGDPQEIVISDSLLKKGGLMDVLKSIAANV